MKWRISILLQKNIMNKRKICVVTGSRADYGLLRPLLFEIKKDRALSLQLVATGMHLSPEFGLTYKEIYKDGFCIDERVDIGISSDTGVGIAQSTALAVAGLAKAYKRLKPDIVVLLGDRYEILGAAIASVISRIPIAHIHGGESTEGAMDESFRHAITKMSLLHLTCSQDYTKRVIQLGENPKTVFNAGALGIDNIKNLRLISKERLEKELKLKFKKRNLLVTFHPVTLENNTSGKQFGNLLSVLSEIKDALIIFTKANSDTDGRIINSMIEGYVRSHPKDSKVFASMGQLSYLSTMNLVDAVVGNSSSGIIEAPAFKVGAINIGDRQRGRIRAKNIIDCDPSRAAIKKAFKELFSSDFQRTLKLTKNPYGEGKAAKRIKNILKKAKLENVLKKPFYNIDFKI